MAKLTLEERIKKLEQEVTTLKMQKLNLKGLKTGDYFEIAGLKWRILDITPQGYHCLAEIIEGNKLFDSNSNDWSGSSLRKWLNNEFHDKIMREIGEDNIIEFERDLLSLDGQTEYGKCFDKISLLNIDEYRKYRRLIPNTDKWWWLINPWSTKCNNVEKLVTVVSPSGRIYGNFCDYYGVRPFCIFSPAIFESEE